ncbi:MAG TPA: DUF1822 family protein [Allocoleopsis sp.]
MFTQKQKTQQKTNIREFLPEIVYLETEDFDQAKKISDIFPNPDQKWQIYINSLAYFGFTKWVKSRLENVSINAYDCSLFKNLPEYRENIDMIYNLRVGDFKVCLIPVESLTESGINIPISLLKSPKFASHFYVLVEVLEEEEQVIIRGLIRHDQVMKNIPMINFSSSVNLSVSAFDPEPNNLLAYLRYLSPDAIALPTDNIVNLRDWLLGGFEETWEAIDEVLDPQINYSAFRFRYQPQVVVETKIQRVERVERLKKINLEKSGGEIGLVMGISSDYKLKKDAEIKIWSEIYPLNQTHLPSGLKLMILDEEETVVMDETIPDQCLEFKLDFTGTPGEHFNVKIVSGNVSIIEEFII